MTSRITQNVGGDWTGLDEGARVNASISGGPYTSATVLAINPLGGLVRVRFDHGFEGWIGRSNVVLVTPAPVRSPAPPGGALPLVVPSKTPTGPFPLAEARPHASSAVPAAPSASPTEVPVEVPAPPSGDVSKPPEPARETAPESRTSSQPVPILALEQPQAAEAQASVPPARTDWAQGFDSDAVRSVFEHIHTHGAITENEATRLLGSARAMRRFSAEFEVHAAKVPFRMRIEQGGDGKRYVKEGDK